MKPEQHQFYVNLIDCARSAYIKVYNMAINSDFSNREALDKLDAKVFYQYCKLQNKPKKCFKTLIYCASTIYNHEIVADSNLCYKLNLLLAIDRHRLYNVHKFIQFIDNKQHMRMIIPGMDYRKISDIINNLLGGIRC